MVKFIKEHETKRIDRAIVLIGSLASQLNIFGFVVYGASKFAIRGIWEALTMECEPLNVRLICAFPPNTGKYELSLDNYKCITIFCFL